MIDILVFYINLRLNLNLKGNLKFPHMNGKQMIPNPLVMGEALVSERAASRFFCVPPTPLPFCF